MEMYHCYGDNWAYDELEQESLEICDYNYMLTWIEEHE